VDDEEEKEKFDPVEYYDTVPEALANAPQYNIPTKESLKTTPLAPSGDVSVHNCLHTPPPSLSPVFYTLK
jgi:hypothetical protein